MKGFFNKVKLPFLRPVDSDSQVDSSPQIQEFLNSVIKLDVNGNLITFNQVFAVQYEYGLKDFKQPFFDIFLQKNAPLAHVTFKEVLFGKTKRFNAIGFTKNGEAVDVNLTLVPIEEQDELIVYVIVQNISEFKKWEKKLHLSRIAQSAFDELENICYFHYDAVNDRFHFSKQFPELFGINEDSSYTPAHKRLLQYIYKEDQNQVSHTFQDALKNKTGYKMEYRIPKENGSFRYVFEKADLVLDENGYIEGLIGFIQDITHCKTNARVIEKRSSYPYWKLTLKLAFGRWILSHALLAKVQKDWNISPAIQRKNCKGESHGNPLSIRVIQKTSRNPGKY